jgi:hypothetical protein
MIRAGREKLSGRVQIDDAFILDYAARIGVKQVNYMI